MLYWGLINQKSYNRALKWLSYYMNMSTNKWKNWSVSRVHSLVNGQNHQCLKNKAKKLFSFKLEIHVNICFHNIKASANCNVPCHYQWVITWLSLKCWKIQQVYSYFKVRYTHSSSLYILFCNWRTSTLI